MAVSVLCGFGLLTFIGIWLLIKGPGYWYQVKQCFAREHFKCWRRKADRDCEQAPGPAPQIETKANVPAPTASCGSSDQSLHPYNRVLPVLSSAQSSNSEATAVAGPHAVPTPAVQPTAHDRSDFGEKNTPSPDAKDAKDESTHTTVEFYHY